ncbi:MAG: hypothetical protein K9G61_10410 [Bacteroidales bacterium]|nr:hypothetical protein [Bacteroidales bacterium]
MKFSRFFLILILIHVISIARPEQLISLEKITVPIYNFGFYLHGVTNATGNPYFIGHIQKSILYENVPAVFEQDIADEVKAFLEKNLENKLDGVPLVVRVNQLEISETYNGMNETAKAEVDLTFIFDVGNALIDKFTCHSIKTYVAGMGVTRRQPTIIGEAIADCFEIFYSAYYEGLLSDDTISREMFYQKPVYDNDVMAQLLAIDRSAKGLFPTFQHFKNNKPVKQNDFVVEQKIRTKTNQPVEIKSAEIFDAVTHKEIDTVWGFSDGRISYIKAGNKYIPFGMDEKGYYIEERVYDNDRMAIAAMVGGLIGSSIAAATTQKSQIRLNIVTGEFVYEELDDSGFPIVNKGFTRVIFYGSDFNPKGEPLEIFMNDKPLCKLHKSSWYQALLDTANTARITLKSHNGMEISEVISPQRYSTTLYLCMDKKKKAPVISKTNGDKEEELLSRCTPENRILPDRK